MVSIWSWTTDEDGQSSPNRIEKRSANGGIIADDEILDFTGENPIVLPDWANVPRSSNIDLTGSLELPTEQERDLYALASLRAIQEAYNVTGEMEVVTFEDEDRNELLGSISAIEQSISSRMSDIKDLRNAINYDLLHSARDVFYDREGSDIHSASLLSSKIYELLKHEDELVSICTYLKENPFILDGRFDDSLIDRFDELNSFAKDQLDTHYQIGSFFQQRIQNTLKSLGEIESDNITNQGTDFVKYLHDLDRDRPDLELTSETKLFSSIEHFFNVRNLPLFHRKSAETYFQDLQSQHEVDSSHNEDKSVKPVMFDSKPMPKQSISRFPRFKGFIQKCQRTPRAIAAIGIAFATLVVGGAWSISSNSTTLQSDNNAPSSSIFRRTTITSVQDNTTTIPTASVDSTVQAQPTIEVQEDAPITTNSLLRTFEPTSNQKPASKKPSNRLNRPSVRTAKTPQKSQADNFSETTASAPAPAETTASTPAIAETTVPVTAAPVTTETTTTAPVTTAPETTTTVPNVVQGSLTGLDDQQSVNDGSPSEGQETVPTSTNAPRILVELGDAPETSVVIISQGLGL